MEGPDPADEKAIVGAATRGNLPEVQRLVQKDSRLAEAGDQLGAYSTPLGAAAQTGHLEVVCYLVEEAGADVNRVVTYTSRPLFMACMGGHAAVVDYLLGKGADPWPPKDRRNALMSAAQGDEGSGAAIKVLLTHGGGSVCDVNDQDRQGLTALHLAIWAGRTENARLLLEAGADWRAADRWGRTSMHLAVEFEQHDKEAELVALIQEWECRYLLSKARRLREDASTLSRQVSPDAASQGRVRAAPAYLAARGHPQVEVRSLEVEGASGSGTGERAHAEEGNDAVREQVLRFALEGMKAELFRELGEVGGMCGW